MTLEPKKIQRVRAMDLTSASLDNVTVRDTHTDGDPWKRVRDVHANLWPVGGEFVHEFSVILDDGSELLFNQDDILEIGIL